MINPHESGCQGVRVPVKSERSKGGQGHPIAVIPADQKRAPWMEVTIAEAKNWAGKTEDEIDGTRNYHEETGANFLKSMSGSSNAWCASFVNWSLDKTDYAKWRNSFRARAVAVDIYFIQIDKPVYGAIGLIGTHHVCLVYGRYKKTKHMVCLGGNQSDQINFTVFKESTKFFVPMAYLPFAKKEMDSGHDLDTYDVKELNHAFGIASTKKTGNTTR